MHNSCRILLSCLVLGAGGSACSGASTPEDAAVGGTAATSAAGSNGLASGGTGGSVASAGAASGGTTVAGGSSGGGGLAGSGGGTVGTSTGGIGTGGISATSAGGTNTTSAGGMSTTSNGGASTTPSGGVPRTSGGSISTSGSTPGTSGGRTTTSGGRISSGGTSTGGISASGGSISTGGGGAGGTPEQGSLPSITVHLAGDSTMANYAASTTQEGWGQEFGQFFISKVTIVNQAQGGANVQSFYSGKWKTLIANVQAGDYVLAAFGINDSGTAHGPVTVPNFTAEFNTMADEVAAKKATFIPTTSSPLQVWVGGKETNDRLQPYCDATIAMGKAKGLLVDDLNARGVEYYNSIGQTAAAALTFNGDKAHFDKAGATEMAQLAAKELTRIGSPLAAYLK